MMFTVHIDCDNAAFNHDDFDAPLATEVHRILGEVARDIHRRRLVPNNPVVLRDINGNKVGFAEFDAN